MDIVQSYLFIVTDGFHFTALRVEELVLTVRDWNLETSGETPRKEFKVRFTIL